MFFLTAVTHSPWGQRLALFSRPSPWAASRRPRTTVAGRTGCRWDPDSDPEDPGPASVRGRFVSRGGVLGQGMAARPGRDFPGEFRQAGQERGAGVTPVV